MALSCIFRPKFRDVSVVANQFHKLCGFNCAASSSVIQSRGVPLVDQRRGYQKKMDVSHLKPLNFDYGGDLKQLEPIDLKEITFKYKDIPEIKDLPDHVKKLFTLDCASSLERLEHRNAVMLDQVTQLIGPGLCVEKQICYLTIKIRNMAPYIIKERRNKKHKAYLIEIISKRKKMLRKLRLLDYDRFVWLLKFLQITYQEGNKYDYYRLGRRAQEKKDTRDQVFAEKKRKYAEIRAKLEVEKEGYYKEKEKILREIDDDIKEYNLDKEEVLNAFENYLKKRSRNLEEERNKLPAIERYRLEEKERKKKESRVF